jgi:hypothetical protein
MLRDAHMLLVESVFEIGMFGIDIIHNFIGEIFRCISEEYHLAYIVEWLKEFLQAWPFEDDVLVSVDVDKNFLQIENNRELIGIDLWWKIGCGRYMKMLPAQQYLALQHLLLEFVRCKTSLQ